jgi:putative transposase
MAKSPEHYRWSSAPFHMGLAKDHSGLLDRGYWEKAGGEETWRSMHSGAEAADQVMLLRRCTYSGRPFGDEAFVTRLEQRFQRSWRRWGFEKLAASA